MNAYEEHIKHLDLMPQSELAVEETGIAVWLSCGSKLTMRRDSSFYEEGNWGDEDAPLTLGPYSAWPHNEILESLKAEVSKDITEIDSFEAVQIKVEFEDFGIAARLMPTLKKKLALWVAKHFEPV